MTRAAQALRRTVSWWVLAACAMACGPPRPNVLLVTLDTTRVDHLSAYGYARRTSPHLDALAEHAVRYTRAYSTSSWTLPAHASLFTGKLPSSHGARYDAEGPLLLAEAIKAPRGIRARGLAPGERTLAERLAAAGYAAAAVVGGPWLLRPFGLAAGFEHYDDTGIADHRGRSAEDVTRASREWLEQWLASGDERPFFLFVNFFDPHFPYDPPALHARAFLPARVEPNPGLRRQYPALYDAEIHYMDQQLGGLFDFLRERGLYDQTLVVVTSDHGELFGEHDQWGHGRSLYEELVAIPLIVKHPGPQRPGRSDDAPLQLHHLYGRILEAAGVASREPAPPDLLLAEVNPVDLDGARGAWTAIWEGQLKYHQSSRRRHRLFDLERDPREQVDLIARRPADAARLRERLARALAELPPRLPPGPAPELDAATRAALEDLGYLDGD